MAVIKINGEDVEFEPAPDKKILDVAKEAGIYIPTLCDHDELEPYGGCRMCLVDVEGMRGYVPACTTTAKDGMVVKTNTEELNSLKKKILELILVEHPSGCIICEEKEQCKEFRPQVQKTGRISGCYTCPNRDMCEFLEVVEYIGMDNLAYEPEYKGIPVEREDPFFDRDYNLCILCARCVRVCDDVRGTSAISIVKRGHQSRIDTAFGVSHVDAGCWFCGACVDVCPTGSLSPRKTKWVGPMQDPIETTCVLCGTGCQINLDEKYGKIMSSGPGNRESDPNHHHLCVLGRFCIPTMVNTSRRTINPMMKKDDVLVPVSWEDAIGEAVRLLKETPADRIGFIASPQMTTEAAYLLQRVAREGVKTSAIDFRGSDFAALILGEMASRLDRIQTLDRLDEVDWILSLGGDFVVTHQVVAKNVYKQVKRGVPLIHIGPLGVNLKRWTAEHIDVPIEKTADVLQKLAQKKGSLPGTDKEQAKRILSIISTGKGAVLIGGRLMEVKSPEKAVAALMDILGENGIVYPLFPLGNEVGLFKAGARADILPGPTANANQGKTLHELRTLAEKGQIDVLYVTDGSVPLNGFEKVKYIIYQSPYSCDWSEQATVLLPSTTFAEEDGTFVNHEFRELAIKKVGRPPHKARNDWQILRDVAKGLGITAEYGSVQDVWQELAQNKISLSQGVFKRKSWRPATREETAWNPKYRGATIAEVVTDLQYLIDALPGREYTAEEESFEELLRRLQREHAPRKEVSK